MRIIIQRVEKASVEIEGEIISQIGPGLLILLGVEKRDGHEDINWLVKKINQLRIFRDDEGNMNRSLNDVGGQLLVVSQFTLHASTKKGNRPSFIKAAKPDFAIPLYEKFLSELSSVSGQEVQSGQFGAMMKISLINDGPVTIFIDSQNKE